MNKLGNTKQKDLGTPSLRLAAARTLEAGLASTGITVGEPTGSKNGVRLVWPKGSSVNMAFVFGHPTSSIGDNRNSYERRVIHVLRRTSSRMREDLRFRGLNFIDVGTGALRITARGLVIDRTDLGRLHSPSSPVDQRSPFSDRASLVTRVLLSSLQQTRRLSDLATDAGVSRALVSRVVNALDEEKLIICQRDGRELRVTMQDPWPLFRRWTEEYRWNDNAAVTVAAPVGSIQRFLHRINEELATVPGPRRWALTLQAAAAQLAPKTKWDVVHLYVDCRTKSDLMHLAHSLKWQPSRQGRVTLLAPRYRGATWWRLQEHHELPTVHEIQLLLDLWHYPIRGREQAEYFASKLGWPPLPA